MKTRDQIEFGDFQTPDDLARTVAHVLAQRDIRPAAIIEPTCGLGTILAAAVRQFPSALVAHGFDINSRYLELAKDRLAFQSAGPKLSTQQADFFAFDWKSFFGFAPEPILVIGNPPWVTAAELSSIQSGNLPVKSNFQKHKGFDALTGKSNFDIAEWMLMHLLEWLRGRRATLAMLVKTAVARKVLHHAWRNDLAIANCCMCRFDSAKHFGVAVDACLFVCDLSPTPTPKICTIADLSSPNAATQMIGFHNQSLIADQTAFDELQHLQANASEPATYRWRSGIKHDCSKVMELRVQNGLLYNGLDEQVAIEDTYLYPMLKGSEVANGTVPSRFMIVPQQQTGQATDPIAARAPKTWRYLCDHATALDARVSSIYRNRPRFSIFGIGPYSFAPWKVAICSLYKKLEFSVIGPALGKPVVLDDISYHLSIPTRQQADQIASILNSETARRFFNAFIFWDAKRAITVDLLQRLDLMALAEELGIRLQPLDQQIKPRTPRRRPIPAATTSLF